MQAIRFKNYRCFTDTGEIELKPVNILLGRNSVGKSSFIKFYPLLKQSRLKHPNGLFLWYSDDVDFGDFKNTVKNGAGDMEFELVLNREAHVQVERFKYKQIDPIEIRIKLRLSRHPSSPDQDYLSNLTISFKDVVFEISYNPEDEKNFFTKLNKLSINGVEITEKAGTLRDPAEEGFLPKIFFKTKEDDKSSYYSPSYENARDIVSLIRHYSEDDKMYIGRSRSGFIYSSREELNEAISRIPAEEFTNIKYTPEEITTFFYLYNLRDIIDEINDYIDELARKIYYMQPVRANAKRYYRLQNLAVDEIDSHGDNLPMYLNSLSKNERDSLNEWIESLFGFRLDVTPESGHIAINIIEKDKNISRNLVDVGFGYSQLLPIIIQIWSAVETNERKRLLRRNLIKAPRIIVIEQPELHLHPKLMADFARMLVAITQKTKKSGREIKFIIETHSEALVEALGILIAQGNDSANPIDEKDYQILLFSENEEKTSSVISVASYDSNGFIEKWPFGFLASL